MDGIVEADRVEVLVLVDNATDALSTNPPDVEAEWPRLWRGGMKRLAGRCLCCAAHGLSCAITAWRGDARHTLLFDTGPDPDVFERNVDRLGFDIGSVDAIVLSHGHWDHAGAMPRALELVGRAAPGRRTPVHLHPGVHARRATRAPDGSMREMEDVPTADALEARGGVPVYATDPQAVLGGLFAISGEIPRVVPFETGLPGQHRRTPDGAGWEPDPWLVDERFVALRIRGRGVLVFTACSHAGVVNVLRHARTLFPDDPLHAVLGGFHLSGTNEAIIPDTVEALRAFDLPRIVPAHCTGWRAVVALAGAFGEAVAPSAVGKTYRF